MPTYNYQCKQCGHEFQKVQSIKDSRLIDCPSCEYPSLRLVIQPSSFKIGGIGAYGKGRP